MTAIDHAHCLTCYKSNCTASKCKIVKCRHNRCKHTFHSCKEDEHTLLCSEVKVSCVNTTYGCVAVIRRSEMSNHLRGCPASVVICTLDWCRDIVENENRLPSRLLPHPDETTPLDLALLMRDVWISHNDPQLEINAEFLAVFNMPLEEMVENEVVDASASDCEAEMVKLRSEILNSSPHLAVQLDIIPRHMIKCSAKKKAFRCGQMMRREEFASHFHDVHSRMMAEIGWLERRCPLAEAGCSYIERRMFPNKKGSEVIFDQDLRCFAVREATEPVQLLNTHDIQITDLPVEVLCYLATFLDSYAIKNLSKVNRRFNNVCKTKLHSRGIVSPIWRKFERFDGTLHWAITDWRRMFSNAISPIRKWGFQELGTMTSHLQTCQYNSRQLPLNWELGLQHPANLNDALIEYCSNN